ncbi:response regulator [Mucilaginibacter sp.]|jgi:PAS domain S-box-containing protein|uniref:response regulator n=1 Tax=Mucilaginibacter sp. TaxID=1882438 RepID=UPI002CAB1974|nr:response regulator [Mucilaginibacter sp.]HTI57758.1 response regulator [Mucilaginibacter sp.]
MEIVNEKKELNILVVEDNPGDFALIEEFLLEQMKQLNLTHAKNCREARSILTGRCEQFDVILLDLSLPDKTGVPLISDITKLCMNTPVIVLTSYTDFAFGIKSLSLGVSDYVLKEELTPISLYKSIVYSLERKKATLELEDSEKRYSDLFHLSPQPMWVFDINTFYFLNVNDAAIVQYGYSRDEFLSLTIKDIRPAGEFAKIKKIIDSAMLTGRLECQCNNIHRKKNGELMRVDTKSKLIEYQGKKAVVTLAIDVTERLNYIKAIELQNQKLKEISWIQSHIVRAPLARIMGLINVFNDMPTADEKEKALRYILLSANELDIAIKEITNKSNIDIESSSSQSC